MWYIIWILVSATIFGKSTESEKWEWLGVPSLMSCVIGGICGLLALIGIL